jgi:hypothetical protein
MILVVIAVLVTIALPNLLSSEMEAQETAALATVRQIVQSQMVFQNRKEADLNGNGTGEFGTFGELSGNVAVRAANGGTRFMDPSAINPSFRAISPLGEMLRNGYYYRLYLPGPAGEGMLELPGGGADAGVSAELAESTWCVYAWPQRYGVTGRSTYFVCQGGDIVSTDDARYSGPGAPLPAGAAFAEPGPAGNINGVVAVNEPGRDGNTWHVEGR